MKTSQFITKEPIKGTIEYKDGILFLHVSGCPHQCKNCESLYKYKEYGIPLNTCISQILNYLCKKEIRFVSIKGEPFCNRNAVFINYLIDIIIHNRDIPIFIETAYSFRELLEKENYAISSILEKIMILKMNSIQCSNQCKDSVAIYINMMETRKEGRLIEYFPKENEE